MHWQHRLWHTVVPHLPSGRVGVWAPPQALPPNLMNPEHTLLEHHTLANPTLPKVAAYDGLLVIAGGIPAVPWVEFLGQLGTLATPHAPLLLLTPRTGLVALHQPGWEAPTPPPHWPTLLQTAGWPAHTTALLGGDAWPAAWATAACRLYVARRMGGATPLKVQFKRKASGTAAATGVVGC